ncbi:hypothetical protein GGI12_004232 [Dipsacomyces acuminosporus]|nr:hypothetical protein GGI12_004232 [Dipsacomyces acuminosporus]
MLRAALTRSSSAKALANSAIKTQTRGAQFYMNKAILVGNVGADPQEVSFANGSKLATFSLATARRYKDAEGNILEHTSWHKIKFGGENAGRVLRLVNKGAVVQVEGAIRYDAYTNKDGVESHATSIQGESFRVISFPKRKEDSEATEPAAEESQ